MQVGVMKSMSGILLINLSVPNKDDQFLGSMISKKAWYFKKYFG